MRNRWLVIVLLALFIIAAGAATYQFWPTASSSTGTVLQMPPAHELEPFSLEKTGFINPNPEKVAGLKGARVDREAWERFERTYPGNAIPTDAYQKAYTLLKQQEATQRKPDNTWQAIGPAPIKDEWGGNFRQNATGRTTVILVHPTDSNTLYAAGAQGGVWKTTNGGANWVPLTDDQPSLAIGSMAFDPQNPNTIYVGTGEPHSSADSYYGAGILKSTDGGNSWTQLGAGTFVGQGIANIVVHPTNSNVIWAAAGVQVIGGKPNTATPGIYRSTDGGSNWARVSQVCSQTSCTSPSSLVIDPSNPNTLYAGFDAYGIVKSTNGGDNWTEVWGPNTGQNFTHGRVEVVIAPSNSNRLYAGISPQFQDGSYRGVVYRSDNGGSTWSLVWDYQTAPLNTGYCGSQCFYDNVLAVSPGNPDVVMAGGAARYSQGVPGIDGVIYKTTDGGTSWSYNSGQSLDTTVHPDLHAITFDPQNPNIVWMGNDGGIYKSINGGNTWINMNTNLGTLQFQGVALHPTDRNVVFGGMQDNAKVKTTDGGSNWEGLDAGDGGVAAIDPFSPNYWYGTRYSQSGNYMQFQRNDNSGTTSPNDWPVKNNGIELSDRVRFYAPMTVDPNTAGTVYWGTHRLWKSTDRGENWSVISGDLTNNSNNYSALVNFAIAPGNSNIILTGSTDGKVSLTTNGGGNWTTISDSDLPSRSLTDMAIGPTNNNVMYLTYNGFNGNTPSTQGHVFKSTDGGSTWSNASNGLPDVPALAIVLDRDEPNTVYVGTDVGVYRSTDGAANWSPYNSGLPVVAVYDLALNPDTDILVAATHGRSIFKLDLKTAGPPTATPTPTQTAPPTATPNPNAVTASAQVELVQGGILHTNAQGITPLGVAPSVPPQYYKTYLPLVVRNHTGRGIAVRPVIALAPLADAVNLPTFSANAALGSNHTEGAPGSVFVFTASGFPANSGGNVLINNTDIGSITTDGSGGVIFAVQFSTSAAVGEYKIVLSVEGGSTPPTATPTNPAATATPTNPAATATPTNPAATATPTNPAATATPTATSQSGGAIVNGDFEQGHNVGWSESSLYGYDLVTSASLPITPRSGSFVAWLGGVDSETSILSQSINVPASGSPSLSYYLQILTQDGTCGDTFYLYINSTPVDGACISGNLATWGNYGYDLSSYAGQTVSIAFRADTDASGTTSVFIDDVSLVTTRTGSDEVIAVQPMFSEIQ